MAYNQTEPRIPGIVWVVLALGITLGTGVWFLHQQGRGLEAADEVDLLNAYDRWTEAGKPRFPEITNFLQTQKRNVVLSTNHFTIGDSTYKGVLALTNPRVHDGIYVITTNRILLFVPSDGAPRIARGISNRSAGKLK
jgi:hypothetical protein